MNAENAVELNDVEKSNYNFIQKAWFRRVSVESEPLGRFYIFISGCLKVACVVFDVMMVFLFRLLCGLPFGCLSRFRFSC